MIAIIGASGLLGSATVDALLSYKLATPDSIIAITSSRPGARTWKTLSDKGVTVRHGNFEDAASLEAALQGVDKFFLISSPCVQMDFNDAPEGQGREKHHKIAIDAARAAGVRHLVYTSLAFGSPSKAGVMRAHIRTEKYLDSLDDIQVTVVREGLYSQSWPIYVGYYEINVDSRTAVPVAGDGKVCWTDLGDLGLAYALILTDPSEDWAGKKFHLLTPVSDAKTIQEVAELVSKVQNKPVKVEVVSREAYIKYFVEEMNMDPASIEWWVGSFEAIADKETIIDDSTLSELLQRKGRRPISMEEIVFGHNPLYDAISDLRGQGTN